MGTARGGVLIPPILWGKINGKKKFEMSKIKAFPARVQVEKEKKRNGEMVWKGEKNRLTSRSSLAYHHCQLQRGHLRDLEQQR